LVREVFRLVREKEPNDRPEWLLYENVKGMLSSNRGWDFAAIQAEMGELGYDVQWQLLNSKDFGVPQNRERVFTLGHLRIKGRREIFPIGEKVNGSVCQQFTDGTGIAYCLDTGYGRGISPNYFDKAKRTQVIQIGNVMPTVTRDNPSQHDAGIIITEATKKGYSEAHEGDSINLSMPNSKTRRERVGKRIANTLDCSCNQATLSNIRIRRLTPRECMRLQGVPDSITDKIIQAGISDTQMYRAAGDAVTVTVIKAIAERIIVND
jgi:DNA (cytosine-5)-methyltransferase 1